MKSSVSTFSVEKPEESSGFLLWQVTNLWHREIKKALEKHEITHSQYVLLASIYWLMLHSHEVTQIVLSNHTNIDPMTTSMVLRSLQKKGFVIRREHQTDTRAKIVELTEKGIETAKNAIITVEKFDRNFFSKLENDVIIFNYNLIKLL